MHKFIEWVKHHPLQAFMLAIAVVLLFVLIRGGGSKTSGASATSRDPNADALAASQSHDQASLAAAGISAGVAGQQIQAGITNTHTAADVQVNSDTLSAQTAQIIAGLQAQVANNTTNAGLQGSLAQTAALRDIALAPYQLAEDQLNSTTSAQIHDLEGRLTSLGTAVTIIGAGLTDAARGNVGQSDRVFSSIGQLNIPQDSALAHNLYANAVAGG